MNPTVTITFILRPLDPISDDEEAPSESLDNIEEVKGKVASSLEYDMEQVEQSLFDRFGWTFDDYKVEVGVDSTGV